MTIEGIREQIQAYKAAGKSLFTTSSFQSHSLVLLHILSRIDNKIPVYFINTGYHFPDSALTIHHSHHSLVDKIRMESAFHLVHAEPPRLSLLHLRINSARTRLTPDTDVAFFLQGVFGQIKLFLVLPDHLCIPVEHGVKPQTPVLCWLFYLHGCTHRALVGTNTVDPHIVSHQDRIHRLRFVKITAMIGIRGEQEFSFAVTLHVFGDIRPEIDGMEAKELRDLVAESHSLGEMITSIDKVNGNLVVDPAQDVQ